MLSIQNVNQFYGQSHTLWDVELEIQQGDCVCVMGRNGVGKTTLLKSIMGSVPVSSGSVKFAASELTRLPASARARLGIGYVPQGREIFPQLSVEENLRLGVMARRDKLREVPPRIFELFPVLKQMLGRRGGDLSGGQQQQLAIGRALALSPSLLILDEPTEGIQPNIVQEIGDILTRLNEDEGLTIVVVEQKLKFARRVGKKFALMDRGRVVAQGPIGDLSENLVQKHLVV